MIDDPKEEPKVEETPGEAPIEPAVETPVEPTVETPVATA